MQEHQQWGVEALWQDLEPLLPGLSIEVLARVESTNAILVDRVRREHATRTHQQGDGRTADARGDARGEGRHDGRSDFRAGDSRESRPYGRRQHDLHPCLLVAEHQTHGRGRQGRSWHSTAGASLTFSISLPLEVSDWSGLSLVVGTAVAEALDPQGQRLQLKWPNDLWLDERKLGGILIETVPAGSSRMAVIGVGLNISDRARVADSQLNTGFAALQELVPDITPPQALARLAPALLQALAGFPSTGFGAWRERFASRDLLQGRPVTAGVLEGTAAGVSERGELLVQTAQGPQAVTGGEVSVRLGGTPGAPAGQG
ncbi:BirA family transcriptional regulator, biotin operon repressor / biotin-[acetyl-CoA-carboxylase] ligase [Roseateles sp. YR242]|uniref:biotin--[acetyl-CoA-carboxylase] ligase n=1 Tax=Roseateles sp. YR242 TaxID=1855305 RepID=UPI0008AEF931|nr:biotin--[acetyl-CoA-carboxylase] ligase [Roseateles sp. YR242]SEL32459.1 BirA family transcriptional regulator, biotin operon repressor / biotin-[acetyl-CoA-carboxylase] ligase [Roseateles sp. YR242]